jgi:hypothetical protein
MSKLLGCAIALALTLSGMPALAGDATPADQAPATFHALSQLPVGDRAALTPLSADQLAAIVGGSHAPMAPHLDQFTLETICGACGAPGANGAGVNADAVRPLPLLGL